LDNPFGPQPLANSNSGNGNLRPETLGATRREKSAQRAKRTAETRFPRAGYGNVALFPTLGNRASLSGLPGGAEGIQTAGHRDLTPSGRGIRQNLSGGRFGHPWQPKFPDRVHPFVNACRASPASKLRPTGNQTWPFWRANPCLAKRFKITPLPGLEPIDRRLVDGYVEARMAVGRQRDERRLRRGQHGEVRARGDETWWNVPPRAGSRASGVA